MESSVPSSLFLLRITAYLSPHTHPSPLYHLRQASYGVSDAAYAVTQLAQTTMRAEIGQMTLDRTLAERSLLNANIVEAINTAALDWGIKCLRYEIRRFTFWVGVAAHFSQRHDDMMTQ